MLRGVAGPQIPLLKENKSKRSFLGRKLVQSRKFLFFLVINGCMAKLTKKEKKAVTSAAKQAAGQVVKQEKAVARVTRAAPQKSREIILLEKQMKANAKLQGQILMNRKLGTSAPNRYLQVLVNPEQFGPCNYPDKFGDKVVLGKFIYNGDVNCDSTNGEFSIQVNPTLPDHLVTLNTVPNVAVYRTDTIWGSGFPGPPFVNSVTPAALPGYWDLSDALLDGVSEPSFMPYGEMVYNGVRTQGTRGYLCGWRLLQGANGTNETVYLIEAPKTRNASPAITLTFQFYSEQMGLLGTQLATAATSYLMPAGTMWIVPAFAVASAGENSITGVSISIALAGQTLPTWIPVQDYDAIVSNAEDNAEIYIEYRTVAMSVLVSYVGEVTKEGGQIAGVFMQSGETPANLGLNSFSAVASLPTAFSGPLRTGLYAVWKPVANADMNFRDCERDNQNGALPYILIAGRQTETSLTLLRVRTCICVEAVTRRAFMYPLPSTVDEYQIEAATLALQGFSMVMENPLHLKDIKDFLRNVIRKGTSVYQSIKPYIPNLIQMASTAGLLL